VKRGAFRTWYWAVAAAIVAIYLVKRFLHPAVLGVPAGVWYEVLYSGAVLFGGLSFLRRYRGKDPYMRKRTIFNMLAQVVVGSTIPLLWNAWTPRRDEGFGYFLMYWWPLEINTVLVGKYGDITPMVKGVLVWGLVSGFIIMPVLVYFLGRRPYCSWFCGCGCLAETLGDPFRRLTPRGRLSRRLEPVVYVFVAAAIGVTAWTLATPSVAKDPALGMTLKLYDLLVKYVATALIGTGLYSLCGARVWCRYMCPWAGLFGLLARHGRYAIETRPELCMGCGQCNTHCEMGIDIRGHAMRGAPVKTTTCVGCGMCIEKCPRRVLSFRPVFGGTKRDAERRAGSE
jgi:ferredoxin-type protein NapH